MTIVAAPPRLDVPCAEQTWPYIDRRCLTESTQKRPEPEGRREAAPVDTPKAPVASVASPPAAAETQGVAPQDAVIKPDANQPAMKDFSEEAELAEDAELYPVLSPRELRRLERMERGRFVQERRMRQHFTCQLFPRFGFR